MPPALVVRYRSALDGKQTDLYMNMYVRLHKKDPWTERKRIYGDSFPEPRPSFLILINRHVNRSGVASACSARRICHQQAFAGPQHLVGTRMALI